MDKITFEDLLQWAHRKSFTGKKYESTRNIDEFVYYVSERILLSVVSIMLSLKRPKRGRYILKILKKFRPKSYYSYLNRENKLFSECLIFIIAKFKKYVEENSNLKLDNHLIEMIATQTGTIYYGELRLNEEEKISFQDELTRNIISYEDNPPKEHNDYLKRIIEILGRKITKEELRKLIMKLFSNESLGILEPFEFIENYKRLLTL